MRIRTLTIAAFALLLAACRKEAGEPASFLRSVYDYSIELDQEGNLNDAIYQYQMVATNCNFNAEDSLAYWWKAMCGQGEIWIQKNFLDYARNDFETVLEYAREQQLDTAEFVACRKLTDIALWQRQYEEAYGYNRRALQLAREKAYPAEMTRGLAVEELLARSGHRWAQGQPPADSLRARLECLAADTTVRQRERVMALRLLALQDHSRLPDYLKQQDEFWNTRYQRFTDAAEREKKGLIAERDAMDKRQKDWLFSASPFSRSCLALPSTPSPSIAAATRWNASGSSSTRRCRPSKSWSNSRKTPKPCNAKSRKRRSGWPNWRNANRSCAKWKVSSKETRAGSMT